MEVRPLLKYSVLLCLIISAILMVIAALLYPGGSIQDPASVGFTWSENFISNLFASKAINGAINHGRIWALIGMAFHSVGYGVFFLHMAVKIPHKHTTIVLKMVGWSNMLFSFLIATPLHDMMVIISSTLSILGFLYITVCILKTKRHLLKICCVLCLLTFYFTLFLYGAGVWGLLAIMQKVSFISSMLLVVALEYFTRPDNFSQPDKIIG